MEDVADEDLYGVTPAPITTPSFFSNDQVDTVQKAILMSKDLQRYLILCIVDGNEQVTEWMGNQWDTLSKHPSYLQYIVQSSIFLVIPKSSSNFTQLQQSNAADLNNKIIIISSSGKTTAVCDQVPRTIDQFIHKFLKMRIEVEGEEKFKDVKFPIILSTNAEGLIDKTKQKADVAALLEKQKEFLKNSPTPSQSTKDATLNKSPSSSSNDEKKKSMEEKLRLARLKDEEIKQRNQTQKKDVEIQDRAQTVSIPSIITPENFPVQEDKKETSSSNQNQTTITKPASPTCISISIKLPDGTSQKQSLPLDSSIKDVFNYVDTLIDSKLGSEYELVIAFPKKSFQKNDQNFHSKLKELQLFPSASFLLVWNKNAEASQKSLVTIIMDSVTSAFHTMVSWFTSFIFLKPNRPIPAAVPEENQQEVQPQPRSKPDYISKRKIHTLSSVEPNPDQPKKKSNWNGNSIQTMDGDEESKKDK